MKNCIMANLLVEEDLHSLQKRLLLAMARVRHNNTKSCRRLVVTTAKGHRLPSVKASFFTNFDRIYGLDWCLVFGWSSLIFKNIIIEAKLIIMSSILYYVACTMLPLC